MAVRTLLFLVGVALGAQGDIRARDPELEDEPKVVPGHGGWERVIPGFLGAYRQSGPHGFRPATPGPGHQPQGLGPPPSGAGHHALGRDHHLLAHRPPLEGPMHHPQAPGAPPSGLAFTPQDAPPSGEVQTPHNPTRTGNWCTFVHSRVVTKAVACGMEKYTIKSQSPCPNGTPDCQLVMYKQSNRPVYRQQQTILTALLWRCCPGHGGQNCEETVTDSHNSDPGNQTAGSGLPGPSATRHSGAERVSQLAGDQRWEQNDFQLPGSPSFDQLHPNAELSAAATTSISHLDLSDLDPDYDQDPEPDYDQEWEEDHKEDHDRRGGQEHEGDKEFERAHDHNSHHSPDRRHEAQEHNQHQRHDHGQDHIHSRHKNPLHNPDHSHEDQERNQHLGRDHNQDLHTRHQNPDHNHEAQEYNPQRRHDHSQDHRHSGHQNLHHNEDKHEAQEHNQRLGHDRGQDLHTRQQNPNRSHEAREYNPHQDYDHRVDHQNTRHQNRDHNHEPPEYNPHQDYDQEHRQTSQHGADIMPSDSPFPEAHQIPSLPILMEALMVQLRPILDGFNRTLERLSLEVGGLSQDLARVKEEREGQSGTFEEGGAGELGADFEAKLDESFHQLDLVKEELRTQRAELEDRIHSQQAMLHYNLTNIKTDTDLKIKRSQKTMQINLHSLNSSLTELKQRQDQLEEAEQRVSPHHGQHSEGRAVWEAIARLDAQVVNNTVRVNALEEDLETENIRDLQRGFRGLEDRIDEEARKTQILFMETGLEVEAAKVEVLDRVSELAGNLTLQEGQLKDLDMDMDYLYTQFYRINTTSKDCDCKALGTSVTQLEKEMASLSKMVEDNRQAIEESVEGQERWEVAEATSVEDLKQGLMMVKESLAFEQEKSRALHLNISQLMVNSLVNQQEIHNLQKSDERQATEIRRLTSSFSSLLKDAIRHTEVLEILLGEEVLEFKERPPLEQEEYAIPMLRDKIQQTLVQVKHQNLSLTSLWKSVHGEDPETLNLGEPESRGLRRRSEDPLEDHLPDSPMGDHPDYSISDFWSLGKDVEKLDNKLSRLEEQRCISCCNCTKGTAPGGPVEELQEEVALLRRGLEDHLRVFKNVFSDMEGLAGSDGTLELDKLWALVKKKEAKKQRRQQREKKMEQKGTPGGRKVNLRSKRDATLDTTVFTEITGTPLMFLAGTHDGANQTGPVVFERVLLNHGQMYSEKTGVFHAPADGVYLFILTVDFGPGPSLLRLKRGDSTAATVRQNAGQSAGPASRLSLLKMERGEMLALELLEGTVRYGNAADNTFAGLLLFRNTRGRNRTVTRK
ncbi:hypothetical protein GJAV_G00242290 [Gymnothorax javanicus]|nr:hypothetical protein GJAV_G00242290 [Gymnothorax javanicus]